MGCCGNQQARMTLREVMGAPKPITSQRGPMGQITECTGGTVRMEFIGRQTAPVWYLGKYQGARDDTNQYACVEANDVARLERTGHWAKVADEPPADPAPDAQGAPQGDESAPVGIADAEGDENAPVGALDALGAALDTLQEKPARRHKGRG